MGLLGHEVQAGMDAGDADEAKASGEEAPGGRHCKIVDASVHGIGSLLEKGEAREIREVERERSTVRILREGRKEKKGAG